MNQQLIDKILEIFIERPDLIDVIKEEGGTNYSSVIFHPLTKLDNFDDLKQLQLTGFKLYLEANSEEDRLVLKIYELEFVSQRGQFPKWQPSSLDPVEQVFLKSIDDANNKVFVSFDNFKETYNTWKKQHDEEKLQKLLSEFSDFRTTLTFDDPFHTWMMEAMKRERSEGGGEGAGTYQDEPEIMDFTRPESKNE